MSLAQRLSLTMQLSAERPTIVLSFGEFMPDLPVYQNAGLTVATNAVPMARSYGPLKGLTDISDALDARCRGASAAKTTAGDAYFYAGDATKLYQIRDNSNTTKGTGFSTSQNWGFAQFGNTILATNYDDDVQGLTVGGGGNFATHITSTEVPKARHIGVVRQFLVLGNINSSTDGVKPNRVHWSAIGNSADFDPDSQTQCDFEDLADGGAVQRIVGGADYGVIFQESLIRRLDYVGSPVVFDPAPVERSRGTPLAESVVGYGRNVFYISEDGFYMFTGAGSVPIGNNKVDNFFWDQFDIANAARMSAAIDRRNKLVCWAFPGEDSTGGQPNRLLFYNWAQNKWGMAAIDVEVLVNAFTQGFTLEELDTPIPDVDAGLGLTVSFDDPQWQGGDLRFAAFNTDSKLAYFTGDNLAATFETGEVQFQQNRRSFVNFVRPLVEGLEILPEPTAPVPTIAMGGRNLLTESGSFGSAVSPNAEGYCPVQSNKRYHRIRLAIPAASVWSHAIGVEALGDVKGVF